MEKYPEPFDTVLRVSPEASFLKVIWALGTTAPAESATVPFNVPVSCCPKESEARRTNRITPIVVAPFVQAATLNFEVINIRLRFYCPEFFQAHELNYRRIQPPKLLFLECR